MATVWSAVVRLCIHWTNLTSKHRSKRRSHIAGTYAKPCNTSAAVAFLYCSWRLCWARRRDFAHFRYRSRAPTQKTDTTSGKTIRTRCRLHARHRYGRRRAWRDPPTGSPAAVQPIVLEPGVRPLLRDEMTRLFRIFRGADGPKRHIFIIIVIVIITI